MKTFKRALVTGASKGLGQEITKALLSRCENLVLVARNEAALLEFKESLLKEHQFKGSIDVLSVDLSSSHALEKIRNYTAPVDLVINNAGLGFMNHFQVNSEEEIAQTIMVNNYNLTLICHHFIKEMLKNKKGEIINISSIAGIFPTPLFSVYGASKAFVLSLSQALDSEFKDEGIRVKAFCPGGIKTSFHQSAGMDDKITEVNGKFMETPEQTAKDIMNLIESSSGVMVPRLYNKFIKLFSQIVPTSFMAGQSKKMYTEFLKAKT